MALYIKLLHFISFLPCVKHYFEAYVHSAVHTRTMGKYAAITPPTSMPMDTIEPLL